MFQSIYNLVADFYDVSGNEAIWLGQMSLVTLSLVLFPSAFLSDFVSVRFIVIVSSAMVVTGTLLKTAASLPLQHAEESNRDLFPLLFTGQFISQFPRAIALPYAGRMANLFFKSNEIARAVACSTSGFTLGLFQKVLIKPLTDQSKSDIDCAFPKNFGENNDITI